MNKKIFYWLLSLIIGVNSVFASNSSAKPVTCAEIYKKKSYQWLGKDIGVWTGAVAINIPGMIFPPILLATIPASMGWLVAVRYGTHYSPTNDPLKPNNMRQRSKVSSLLSSASVLQAHVDRREGMRELKPRRQSRRL